MSIPKFEILVNVDEKDLLNIWNKFMKKKNECKNSSISFCNPGTFHNSSLHDKTGLGLGFPSYYVPSGKLPHIRLLSMIGEYNRSFQIVVPNRVSNKNDEISNTIDWLFGILQIYPLMEEITIYDVKCDKSLNFLNYISLNLSNLSQLSLTFDVNSMDLIIINTPHTSLDLIT